MEGIISRFFEFNCIIITRYAAFHSLFRAELTSSQISTQLTFLKVLSRYFLLPERGLSASIRTLSVLFLY